MIVKSPREPETFAPVTIAITLESADEVEALYNGIKALKRIQDGDLILTPGLHVDPRLKYVPTPPLETKWLLGHLNLYLPPKREDKQ